MKQIHFVLVFFMVQIYVYSQPIKVDSLKIVNTQGSGHAYEKILYYPVLKTGNFQIDSLINNDIKNKLTNNEYEEESIDSALAKWTNDVIVFLDFQVTYNKNNIISLHISAEGCGANCSGWTEYFNYSTLTGKSIEINSVVSTKGKFSEAIIKAKNNQYEKQRNNLKVLLLDEESGLDSLTYELVLENYYDCESSSKLEKYALYSDYLEIIEECFFSNYIKNFTPVIELKYKYSDIRSFLIMKVL